MEGWNVGVGVRKCMPPSLGSQTRAAPSLCLERCQCMLGCDAKLNDRGSGGFRRSSASMRQCEWQEKRKAQQGKERSEDEMVGEFGTSELEASSEVKTDNGGA